MSKRRDVPAAERRAALLNAAREVFSRYGYQRTAMADIAEAARVSRPALYAHFRSKEDVFRSLAERLCAQALEAAKTAWPAGAAVAQGLTAASLAKDLTFFRLMRLSPHGAELMAQHHALTGDCQARLSGDFADFVAARLGGGKKNKAVARTMVAALDGLKANALGEEQFVAMVRQLCALFGAGLTAASELRRRPLGLRPSGPHPLRWAWLAMERLRLSHAKPRGRGVLGLAGQIEFELARFAPFLRRGRGMGFAGRGW